MLTLAINTASLSTAIALLETRQRRAKQPRQRRAKQHQQHSQKPPKILAETSWPSQNDEAEKLMPAINGLLKKVKKNFPQIQRVLVVRGPGSFTGLRIGVTVANTIAYLNRCELIGISTFEYWHAKSELPVLIYAGSGGVYLSTRARAGLSTEADQQVVPELISLTQLGQTLKKFRIKKVTGDITKAQKESLKSSAGAKGGAKAGAKFIIARETFATTIQKILKAMEEPRPVAKPRPMAKPPAIIEPLYIKPPGITKPKNQAPCYT